MDLASGAFWASLGSIVLANLVLSGDNAIVIAMAARSLPERHRRQAIVWGSAAAILMRMALTALAVQLLALPGLRAGAALLLLVIGVQLLAGPQHDQAPVTGGSAAATLGTAIRLILVADFVMSLDNVLAVVAAARDNVPLLILGLAVSVPLIVFGSTMLLAVMQRWPVIVTGGAAVLGYLAATLLLSDRLVTARWGPPPAAREAVLGVLLAALVVLLGRWRRRR